ncbi:cytidylate kinase [Candidatus Bathyarchaeota archaeon]|nr:MAG: cytidylate kinase [Candidatus Bathyarchaeota archaeon]
MLLPIDYYCFSHSRRADGIRHSAADKTITKGENVKVASDSAIGNKNKLVICICGMAGSGKSTVAKRIARHYGLRYSSGGDALKAVAAELGYRTSGEGWWETEEGIRFLKERSRNPEIDRRVDQKQLEWAKEGGIVFDSWAMPWLLRDGFKVWLEASEEVRAHRIAERDKLTPEEALKFLREKEARTKRIYKKLYGFSLGEDFSPFHLIIDVNLLSKDEVFEALRLVIDRFVLGREDSSI